MLPHVLVFLQVHHYIISELLCVCIHYTKSCLYFSFSHTVGFFCEIV